MFSKGYSHNFYGGNSYIPHPGYPMQIPTVAESQVPPGLIPVELDIEGLFEERDRRRTRNGSEKTVASHIHSVYLRFIPPQRALLIPPSAAGLKIERLRGLSEIGKRNT
jgi:hypothetical protein